jgi:hypothetical protein
MIYLTRLIIVALPHLQKLDIMLTGPGFHSFLQPLNLPALPAVATKNWNSCYAHPSRCICSSLISTGWNLNRCGALPSSTMVNEIFIVQGFLSLRWSLGDDDSMIESRWMPHGVAFNSTYVFISVSFCCIPKHPVRTPPTPPFSFPIPLIQPLLTHLANSLLLTSTNAGHHRLLHFLPPHHSSSPPLPSHSPH